MMRRARGLVRGVRSSFVDMRWALVGGAVSTIIAVSGLSLVGRVSGFEGRALVESLMPTVRFLASTVATAAATILALMVTLLGLSQSMDRDLNEVYYRRVHQIAWMSAIAIVAATGVLLLLSIPLERSDEVVREWYDKVYYAIVVLSSGLGGLLIALVLMLLNTVRGLIHILSPHTDTSGDQAAEGIRELSPRSAP